MKFSVTPPQPETPVHVTIEQDGDDVDILLDGQLVAAFIGSSGELDLYPLEPKLPGVELDEDGYIQVVR